MMAPLATYAYRYDAAGRLTAETTNGASTSYGYDPAGQVTAAGAATFSYDRNGNRTNPGYATGAGNQLTTDGVWTYTYDAAGAVSRKTDGSGNGWAFGYNHRGQLVSAAYTPAGSGSATQVGTYVYDAFGNQVESDATSGGSTTVTRVGLDGWDPAQPGAAGTENFVAWADLSGSNTLTARRVFGPLPGAPAVGQTAAGAVSWYTTDLRGSVRAVLDNAGSVTNATGYDAFGVLVSGVRADRYGYTGQGWDSLTGLQANGNGMRAYDPRVGRWLQPDPLGFGAGDPNLYRHVGNAPTNWIDPSGLDRLVIVGTRVSFERTYYITPWSNGGTYDIGSLVELEGVLYVRHGQYMVPLDQVRNAIERSVTVGYGGEWRENVNKMTEWFKSHDVAKEVKKPADERKVADRMYGPAVIVGGAAVVTVLAMVTEVTEAVVIDVATTLGPGKFAEFLGWAAKKRLQSHPQ